MDQLTIKSLTATKSLNYHAGLIAPILHETDKEEIAVGGHDPVHTIANGIRHAYQGECYTVFGEDGEPAFITGICDIGLSPETCSVWLLSTVYVNRYARQLLQASPMFLDRWNRMVPKLVNVIWEGNATHLRWCRLMDFNIGHRIEFNGAGFLPIERTRECVNQSQ